MKSIKKREEKNIALLIEAHRLDFHKLGISDPNAKYAYVHAKSIVRKRFIYIKHTYGPHKAFQ